LPKKSYFCKTKKGKDDNFLKYQIKHWEATKNGCLFFDMPKIVTLPAFADLHVHFREPGFTEKETIRTGSLAAAAGGYTSVCTMPNLNPVPDNAEHLKIQQEAIERDAIVQVLPYCSITVRRTGLELVDMHALKHSCVAFSDDGSGVQSGEMMLRAMEMAAKEDCIIAAHCEDNSLLAGGMERESEWAQIERDIALCEKTGCRYHVCHISTRESVDLIRDAKLRGLRISCETAPHYLVFEEGDVLDEGRFRMNPPIRRAEDREALRKGLADGTIDAIATDHAPHTAEQKSRGFKKSAMGIVGLETAFPVLYTHLVEKGIITLERLIQAMSTAPRKIFRIDQNPLDTVTVDLSTPWTIDSRLFASMGHSTPFDGMTVKGRILETKKNGITIYGQTF